MGDDFMERVEGIVRQSANKFGLVLVEFEIKRGNIEAVVYSRTHNVSIDELEKLTLEIQNRLSEVGLDTIYGVNLSSPGMDRVLKSDRELEIFRGRLVRMSYFEDDKSRVKIGNLMGREGDMVVIEEKGEKIEIPFEKITSVQLWDEIFEKKRRR
jgi:ribosome maturation factor RimP